MRITTITQGFEIFIQPTRIGNIALFFVHNRNFNTGFRAYLTPESMEALIVLVDQFLQNNTVQQPFQLFRDDNTNNTLSCFIQQNSFDFILGFNTGNITVSLNKIQTQILKRTLLYYPIYVMIENNRRQNMTPQQQKNIYQPFAPQPNQPSYTGMRPPIPQQSISPQNQPIQQSPIPPQSQPIPQPPFQQPPISLQNQPIQQSPIPPVNNIPNNQITDLESAISELESMITTPETGGY